MDLDDRVPGSPSFDAWLFAGSVIFLCLPYLVFLGGWLRPPYAAPALVLLACGTGVTLWSARRPAAESKGRAAYDRKALAATLLPVLLVVLLTGVGGFGFQDRDWLRGNAVFRDLIEKSWPVVYDSESGPILLVYYVAFYLPAALVGKILGWQAANLALFLYGSFGLALAVFWVVKLTGIRRLWCVPLFLLFSGMDVVGAALRRAGELATGAPMQSWRNLEWWAGYGTFSFPANLDLLVLAPNQALPGWLLTALVLHEARAGRLEKSAIFLLGLCTLWAPYVAMGLLPCVLVLTLPRWIGSSAVARRGESTGRSAERATASGTGWGAFISWPNALGLFLGLVVVGYLSSRFFPYVLPIDVSGLHQERLTLSLFRQGPRFLVLYPIFALLEFGILHALIYGYLRFDKSLLDAPLRKLLLVSSVGLALLPWINFSWNNDIVMRASVPFLFVTALGALKVLDAAREQPSPWPRRLKAGVLLVLCVGAVNSGWIATRQLEGIHAQGSLHRVPEARAVQSLFELQAGRYDKIGYNFVGQYLGSPDAPFPKYVLAERSR